MTELIDYLYKRLGSYSKAELEIKRFEREELERLKEKEKLIFKMNPEQFVDLVEDSIKEKEKK